MQDPTSRTPNDLDDDSTRISNSSDDLTRHAADQPLLEDPEEDATLIAEPSPASPTHHDAPTEIDDAPTKIAPGVVLKQRFHLLEVIGSGGMGTVYKAIDKRDIEAGNSNFIAVKIINDEYKNDTDLLKALHSEARKTQTLAHPNIMTVYDFDRENDSVFVTMEYIDGAPLNQLIRAKSKGLEVEQVLGIIRQLCDGLSYAHSKNIIHLDFKPSNVLIDQNQRVKIFDFGIARMANFALSRTFDAGILGGLTPSYASLEMINGEAPDPADDIYALACVSYELLTGHHPFDKKPANEALKQHLSAPKPKGLNSQQWQTLKQGLAIHRKDRLKTVEQFKQGLLSTAANKSRVIGPLVITAFGAAAIAAGVYIFGFPPNPTDTKPTEEKPTISKPDTITKPDEIIPENVTPHESDTKETEHEQEESGDSVIALPGINIQTGKSAYKIGDQLHVSFTVEKPMFTTLLHIDSKGETSVLFPNPFQEENYSLPGTTYHIPPLNAEFNIDIRPPRGQDIIVAIGSDIPLSEQELKLDANGEPTEETRKAITAYSRISYGIE